MAADLDDIVQTIQRAVPLPQRRAILLIGGFGRGEGGVLSVPGDGWRAFNDYDLTILVDGYVDETVIPPLSVELARRLDIDFVDIGVIQRRVLEGPPLDTIFAYELKAGHRVLDGPPDALHRMPAINPATLPLVEATRLLVNRGWGLVWARLHLEEAVTDSATFDRHRRRFTVNAMHKGVLAVGEAALLLARRYDVSYRERARRLAELELSSTLGDQADEFRAAFLESTRFKLSPLIPDDGADRLVDRWTRVGEWHEAMLRHVEAHRLGHRFGDWNCWSRAVMRQGFWSALRRPRRFLSERSKGVGGGPFWLDRDHDFRRRLPALLYGHGGERLGDDWRSSARRQLEAWHP
ncbi:MAG: hypothetical protein SGI90_02915 [Candidatus Eisenbacteria bacterium]|nr:hypothetical protein [Candidatus Eisenbacteria bacterium]